MLTDIRVTDASVEFSNERFRTPLKFGTGAIETITTATICVTVENRRGQTARGYGQILLSDLWAFPSPLVPHEFRDSAMRKLSQECCTFLASVNEFDHPIDLFLSAKPEFEQIAQTVSKSLELAEPIPVLATLVSTSPLDAAVHDAFGNINNVSVYNTYNSSFMRHDLSQWLGNEFSGFYPSDFLTSPSPTLPIFHLVGGVDKLLRSELNDTDPQDGLPVALQDWIVRDGVYCLKVKLRGTDTVWDVERTCEVYEIACEELQKIGSAHTPVLSTDSNEMNPDPESVVEYLHLLKEKSPAAWESLLYLEQPTERDILAHEFDMRKISSIKPVIVDEGVTSLYNLNCAVNLGWSGIALKTCKGHSASVLYVAKAHKHGLALTVQDLTNPGLSFVHSAGLAARVSPLMGVEYNSRQYMPAAQPDVRAKHEALFTVKNGQISNTTTAVSSGLGY